MVFWRWCSPSYLTEEREDFPKCHVSFFELNRRCCFCFWLICGVWFTSCSWRSEFCPGDDLWPEVLPVDVGENARHNTSESWASIFTSSSRKSRLKILNTHTQKHVSRSFYLCEDHVLFHSIRPCRVSYCRFPQRSPAARCCPSGLIPSTLIPVFPSAPADSPLSPSACRCCVFSPTYKILSRSWKTHRKWFMPTNKTRELLQAFCRLVLVHLFTCTLVCCWSYVAVEVSVCGGRVSVPQSDGVIRRTGEEGGWRQTGLRRIRQLRIHLKRKNTNRFTTTPEYIYSTHTSIYQYWTNLHILEV